MLSGGGPVFLHINKHAVPLHHRGAIAEPARAQPGRFDSDEVKERLETR